MQKQVRSTVSLALGVTLALVAFAACATACPMCKDAIKTVGLSKGYYYSIITMAFLPMSLVSGGAIFVIKSSYQKKHPESTLGTYGMVIASIKERFSQN